MAADLEVLAEEQAYFDVAEEARERFRQSLEHAPSAAAHAQMAHHLRRHAERARLTLGEPGEAVALGRLDFDGDDRPLYVGLHAVWDEDHEPLVVNWKAPIAKPFRSASLANPLSVTRKRTFSCTGSKIDTYDDLVFKEISERVGKLIEEGLAPTFDDALLNELGRQRTGEMQQIVQTIQAAQSHLIDQPLDRVLVVQGGPGTGKTVVALHRVSWLLYNHVGELVPGDVLIVGPNRTFVRYIRQVLPTLGDADVKQVDLTGLAPSVRAGRVEADEVTRLKGDARMRAVLDRALRDRITLPEGDIEVRVHGRQVPLAARPVRERIHQLLPLPYNTGRAALRDWIREEVRRAHDATPASDALDLAVERVWPQLSSPAFLQDLLGSEARLLRAAGETLTGRDVQLMYRRAAARLSDETWSRADLPLLDHVEVAMNGQAPKLYGHIVVDEAQDLSPMQLASIARRLRRPSLTLLGDLAQSTGMWLWDSWQEVVDQLTPLLPEREASKVQLAELTHGYRVPRQLYDFAARLLPGIAPALQRPDVVREGPSNPVLHLEDEDDVPSKAVDQAMEYSARGLMVAVLCPPGRRSAVVEQFTRKGVVWRDSVENGLASGINLLDPESAKGLEVDATVVAYPEDMVGEHGVRGGRLLYIALTRSTRELALVYTQRAHALPLFENDVDARGAGANEPLAPSEGPRSHAIASPPAATTAFCTPARPGLVLPQQRPVTGQRPRAAQRMAEEIAEEVRDSLTPQLWLHVLEALDELLRDEPDGAM